MALITTLNKLLAKITAKDEKLVLRIASVVVINGRYLSGFRGTERSYRSTYPMYFWLILAIILSNCDKTILGKLKFIII